jgi:5-methylcytosine-specific restriction endonuclease McrA
MARFDLNSAFDYIFPQTPNGICRYCRKPIPKEMKRRHSWCEGHLEKANMMLSWDKARRITFDRDKGICQRCGVKVYLYGFGGDVEANLKYYKDEFKDPYRPYYLGERKAEIHHVIPMTDLMDTAWKTAKEAEEDKRDYWFWKLGVMLQLDTNNLITLCQKPCHDDVHNHAANEAKKEAHRLRDVPRLETYAEG